MHRNPFAPVVVMLLAAAGLSACAALGPKANVSLVSAEVKGTKSVDNIVIPNVTGIDASGNTGKALLAAALKAYGTRSRPIAAAKPILSGVGAPDGLADILTVGYQAEFIKAVEHHFKKGGKKPDALDLPRDKLGFKVPDGVKGMQTIVKKITAEAAAIGEIQAALAKGDGKGLASSIEKSDNMLAIVGRLNALLFEKMDVTYVLVTHVVGDEGAWMAGKKVQYAAALVNIKTGKLRYFATVEAQKGAIPTPYMAQLGIMASSLFDSVAEQDPLPAKAKEETAFLHLDLLPAVR